MRLPLVRTTNGLCNEASIVSMVSLTAKPISSIPSLSMTIIGLSRRLGPMTVITSPRILSITPSLLCMTQWVFAPIVLSLCISPSAQLTHLTKLRRNTWRNIAALSMKVGMFFAIVGLPVKKNWAFCPKTRSWHLAIPELKPGTHCQRINNASRADCKRLMRPSLITLTFR